MVDQLQLVMLKQGRPQSPGTKWHAALLRDKAGNPFFVGNYPPCLCDTQEVPPGGPV